MQARRAARELALILFSQLNKEISSYTKNDFESIILKSVRTLANEAANDLKINTASLFEIREFIQNHETDSEVNLRRPIGTANKPVGLPMTNEMIDKIDVLVDISDKALTALEIAEMATLEEKDNVKGYILSIVEKYQKHSEEVDSEIQKYSKGWNFNRLVKIDKDILRIAITELLFLKDAPLRVVIDEALELAKKYSTDDSTSFINGILGKVVENNKVKK